VIRPLPQNTPAENISDGLVNLGFDVISVKQMTATRRPHPEGSKTANLPLFLITLPRTAKSHEIFRLPSLCHIAIRVEVYRAQNGLTQCHNCQQFGHVWANCKQPPRCLWRGGGTRSALRRGTHLPPEHAATAGWRKKENHILPIIGVADTKRRSCRKRSPRKHQKPRREGCSLPPAPPQA
jgi:hypothetical protein